MATILEFRGVSRQGKVNGARSSAPRTSARQNCEVVLFPGVRYERWADAAPPQASRYDRLDLME